MKSAAMITKQQGPMLQQVKFELVQMQQPRAQKQKNLLTFRMPHLGRDFQQDTLASTTNS